MPNRPDHHRFRRRVAGPSRVIRLTLTLFVLLIAAVVPQPVTPNTGVLTLAAASEDRWIPFSLTPGNQILFRVTLDGKNLAAVLDTGLSDSLIARGSTAVDPARLTGSDVATAIGGDVAIAWMATDELTLGGLSRRGGRLAVAPLPAVATGGGTAIDLLIGRDLLAGYALDIDYPARRFRLLRSGRLPFAGSTAPLAISARRHVYESALMIGEQRLAPMVVDTGDGATVTIAADGWTRAVPREQSSTTAIAYGLAGPLVTELAILPTIRLGALTARQVEVRAEPPGGFSSSIGVAGRIGSGFLGRYRVLLDPGAGRMVLSPGPEVGRPPLRSTSGLLLGLARDRLRVLHVMRGSPAATAGWREGDLICAIDGQPVTAGYLTSPLARWGAAPAGTTTRLADCAGKERTLVAREFY